MKFAVRINYTNVAGETAAKACGVVANVKSVEGSLATDITLEDAILWALAGGAQ